MRKLTGTCLALALMVSATARADDDAAAKAAAQKKKAEANWEAVEAGPAAFLETAHLLIFVPKAQEKRLKELGTLLEKDYEVARKALVFKDEPWPGKLAVYVFAEREPFTAFVRRVEKRRVEADDVSGFEATDDELHVVVGPARTRYDAPTEVRAGEGVAAVLLTRKAVKDTVLPDWLVAGFGRATHYRAAGPRDKFVQAERQRAALLSKKKNVGAIWGEGLEAAEAGPLRGSLVDFLAYGPGASKFAELVGGFQPEQNMPRKTTAQALQKANVQTDRIEAGWKVWVLAPR
jgi:hypothetical protein